MQGPQGANPFPTKPPAASSERSPTSIAPNRSTCRPISYLTTRSNNRVIAQGNVEIYYNNYVLTADQVVYDQGVNKLIAEGNAHRARRNREVLPGRGVRPPRRGSRRTPTAVMTSTPRTGLSRRCRSTSMSSATSRWACSPIRATRRYRLLHRHRPERAAGASLPQLEDPSDPLLPERFFVPVPEAWLDARCRPSPAGCRTRPIRGSCVTSAIDCRTCRRRKSAKSTSAAATTWPTSRPSGQARFTRAHCRARPRACARRLRGDELGILRNLARRPKSYAFPCPGEGPRFSLQSRT